jgi:acyl-CoA dehydrogenase
MASERDDCIERTTTMKTAYATRQTPYTLSPEDELNDLRMSEQVRPLFDHVRRFIATTVEPMSHEFYRAGAKMADRWSFTPSSWTFSVRPRKRQRKKASGTFFFRMPRRERV